MLHMRGKLTVDSQNGLLLVLGAGLKLVDDLQAVVLGHLGHLGERDTHTQP